jgi:serine/threonine protein kinase
VRDRDGIERIKLVDFGIAQVSEPNEAKLTGIGALIGTPAYMAFEQLCALADIDARADVYALGVVMFECLTGEVPYVGNYPRILMQVSSADPPPSLPAGIPAALAAVVARACAKKREDRFASAEDFAAAIRDAFPKASMRTNLLGHIARPDLPPTVAQRRKFPRAPYTTPVHILLPFGTIDGRSEDISEGGMLVICRERCEDKVPVSVRFALPIEGRVVTCVANLRWLRAAQSDNPEGPRALGLEFVNASEALRTSVRRYVDLMGNEERANELLT